MKTEQVELTEDDCKLLDSVRMDGETRSDVLSRLLASVEIVDRLVADNGVPQGYKND